jgi:predicted MPP superfamily phosphohydrolase
MSLCLTSALAVAGLAGTAYAVGVERRWIQVTRCDVPLPDLPAELDGFTIAHLSDIHYGPMMAPGLIERAVARVNALQPDLVALTGDFVDGKASEVEPAARMLGGLRARHGVWAVLGGHDITASERVACRAYPENGIRLLRNAAAPLNKSDPPFWIVGVHDNSEYYLDRLREALSGVPERARILLLAHSPDIAPEAREAGVDLVLSGHTHGGQICAPLYGAILTETRLGRIVARGLNRFGDTWIYTCRGLGVVRLPARFLCRPEIALLRLVRAGR